MTDESASAVAGSTVEWTLHNPRRKETRTFEQSSLTIEGEARLVGLARKVGAALGDADYTFGDLGKFLDDGPTDWNALMELLARMSDTAPDLLADAMTVFLGLYPTQEDGTPNPDFEDQRLFLRGSVNLAKWTDMARVFLAQNEYERLIAPFSKTLAEAMDAYAAKPESSGPSAPQAIVGGDGSMLELEPLTSETTTGAPLGSETETHSAASRGSSKRATATRGNSGDDSPSSKPTAT